MVRESGQSGSMQVTRCQDLPPSRTSTTGLRPRPARRFSRTRHGCLTCRQRKKKCDEVRPCCAGCSRNKLDCQWPDSRKGTPTDDNGHSDFPSPLPETAAVAKTSTESRQAQISRRHNRQDTATDSSRDRHLLDARHPRWNRTVGAFTITAKATLVTPSSSLFLHHYLANTGSLLASVAPEDNPFITYLIPMAYSDDLIMHCLMALGGIHLGSVTCWPRPASSKTSFSPVEADAALHYSCALRGLRTALDDVTNTARMDTEKLLRALTAVILVAKLETLSRSCLGGMMFSHLSAARELMHLLHRANGDASQPLATADANKLLGLVVEAYSYLTLVNLVGPPDSLRATGTQIRSLSFSLDMLERMGTGGSIFNGCQGLLSMLLRISALWTTPDDEKHACDYAWPTGVARADIYASLRSQIMHWQPPPAPARNDGSPAKKLHDDPERHSVIEAWRHALAIYLEAAYADTRPLSTASRRLIAEHVRHAATLIMTTNMTDSQCASTLGWPMIILGSCLEDERQRMLAIDRVRTTRLRTWNSVCGLEVLRLLWEDMEQDEMAFGPYGLCLTLRKFGLKHSIA